LLKGRLSIKKTLFCLFFMARTMAGISQRAILFKPKIDILDPVTVTPNDNRPLIRIDTIEYNAAAIRLNRDATIEALLRRLPGIEVGLDGKITFNGQKIERLLVDGEDIFGASPTIITRNFDATAISKVQIIDRKSGNTQFSGIDDGTRTKTINLVLKEDRRHSYFGKIEAGGDMKSHYETTDLLSSFSGKQQIMALGMASNLGNAGFFEEEGHLAVMDANPDPLGGVAGNGIPQVFASGLHYANTSAGMEDHLAGNYQFGHLNTKPVTSITAVQTLPGTIYVQRQQDRSVNSQDEHLMDLVYDYNPNNVSSLKFFFTGRDIKACNQFNSQIFSTFNDSLVNNGIRYIYSNVEDRNLTGRLFWKIGSRKKPGRSFSIISGLHKTDDNTNGNLYSLNMFFKPDGYLQTITCTDQRKQIGNNETVWDGSLNYTDSLGKHTQWGANYSISISNNKSKQNTYERGDGKYDIVIDSLSNDYHVIVTRQRGGLTLQSQRNKLMLILGLGLEKTLYNQENLLLYSQIRKEYHSVTPQLRAQYVFNPSQTLTLTWFGGLQPISIAQLQPVQNNNDPLHITMGNPYLRPGYAHTINGNWQSFKRLRIILGTSFTVYDVAISTRTSTDSLGKQVSQAVNVNGTKMARTNFSLSHRFPSSGLDVQAFSSFNYTRSYNYVGTALSKNDQYTGSYGISLGKYVPDKFNFQFKTAFGYTYTRSSVDPSATIHYQTQNHEIYGGYFPAKQMEIGLMATYTWRQNTKDFDSNNSILYLSATIKKYLLKNQILAKVSANNLLNKNIGISRTSSYNQTTESFGNTMGRYWILSLTYRFDHPHK